MSEEETTSRRYRKVTGILGLIEKVFLICIPVIGILFVLDVHTRAGWDVYREQYIALLLGLVLGSAFLSVPAHKAAPRDRVPWYDIVLAFMGFGICLYAFILYPGYLLTGPVYLGKETVVIAFLAILLIADATRRLVGWAMVLLLFILMFYAKFNYLLPAPFLGQGTPWDRLALYLFLDNGGLLGTPLWVVGSIVFGFILFGQILFAVGGGQFLNDFSLATMGKYRGGAAKMAILGSSLFGTISGSAVANVSATGVMTIPMMKKSGYKPEIAGAIEAVASTGGQFLPPVMGITAFIVAEILGVPYSEVAIAAIVPAVLFYYVLFIHVDLEAAKAGLKGLSEESPPIRTTLKQGWTFILSLVVLVYTLFFLNFEAGKAAVAATAAAFVFGLIKKETRIGLFRFIKLLEGTGRGLLEIGAICGTAGLVLGVIYTTGLGTTISHVLLKVGGENLFLMLLYSALVSIVLGMGMPTAPVYIILAVLIAPAIVKQNVVPMAAHLFIFYFGVVSMITPPVCIASYAAASIAKTSPMSTGFYAARFGITGFIVPFIFVYNPALLLYGSFGDILLTIAKATVALGVLTVAMSGFFLRKLGDLTRLLLGLGGFCMLIPRNLNPLSMASWQVNLAGLVLCTAVLFRLWMKRRSIVESGAS
ncbi:MAG: TRAP transporter fused permease subunit [Pseudomonadota bacterium]